MNCLDCRKPLCRVNTSGRCRRCFNLHTNSDPAIIAKRAAGCRKPRPILHCCECSAPISRHSKSGRCRKCVLATLNTDPGIAEKRRDNMRAVLARPEVRRKISETIKRKFRDNPQLRELAAERARKVYHLTLGSPQARAAAASPETRAKIGKAVSKAKLKKRGIPDGYRNEYMRLVRNCGIEASEAACRVKEKAKADEINRLTATRISGAIDYLRRYTPVIPRPGGYLYGTAILTPEELVQRAINKGWQPERWAA